MTKKKHFKKKKLLKKKKFLIRTSVIIYTTALVLMLIVPVIRYYVSTPWINACVLEYVDEMKESNYEWTLYDIDWLRHIEAWDTEQSLEQYEVGKANWCIMSSDNLFIDLNNTFYCSITYIIKHLPIDEELKEPLWIMKSE